MKKSIFRSRILLIQYGVVSACLGSIITGNVQAAETDHENFYESTATDGSSPPLIVEGQRQENRERIYKQQIGELVRSSGVVKGAWQLARWVDPVCPKAVGILPQYAAQVENRIRKIATEIGAPVAKEGCQSNLAIIFTENSDQLIGALEKTVYARYLHSGSDVYNAFRESQSPVKWVFYGEYRPRRHSENQQLTIATFGVTPGVPQVSYDKSHGGNAGVQNIYSASLISKQFVRTVASYSIFVDVNKAHGLPLDSISDYISFVSLAKIEMPAPGHAVSILNLFQDSNSSRKLTKFDISFLKSIYKTPLDREAFQQRVALTNMIVKNHGAEQGTMK